MWVNMPRRPLRMRIAHPGLDLNITVSSEMSPHSVTRGKNSQRALLRLCGHRLEESKEPDTFRPILLSEAH